MKETVDSCTQQGNTWFLAGNNNNAITCYYKALKKSGALTSIVKNAKKKQGQPV